MTEMKPQTFNLRSPCNGFFLGTVQLLAKTDADITAKRLRRYIIRRMKTVVSVNPVLNA